MLIQQEHNDMNHPTQQQKVSFSRPCPPSGYNPVIHIMPANHNDAASASVPFMALWDTQKLEAGKEIHVQQHRIHDTDGISVNKKRAGRKLLTSSRSNCLYGKFR